MAGKKKGSKKQLKKGKKLQKTKSLTVTKNAFPVDTF